MLNLLFQKLLNQNDDYNKNELEEILYLSIAIPTTFPNNFYQMWTWDLKMY